MRILLWHVHGAWTTSLVAGDHDYLVPVVEDRGPDGRGRARTYDWPGTVAEVRPEELARADVDVVVLQRPRDIELCQAWLGGRRIGADIPAVYVEHNAPQGLVNEMRHPLADAGVDVHFVHVTHANALLWDTGTLPTTVIEHGIPDPGHRYTGELERAAVVINEPVRRGRVTGTDLLGLFAQHAPLDVFGIDTHLLPLPEPSRALGDVAHGPLLDQLGARRVYVHPYRWTSLGLALIEAMMLGLPVVVVASLEAGAVIPTEAGLVTNRVPELVEGVAKLLDDPGEAKRRGDIARAFALSRFGLDRFLAEWNHLFKEIGK